MFARFVLDVSLNHTVEPTRFKSCTLSVSRNFSLRDNMNVIDHFLAVSLARNGFQRSVLCGMV